MRDRERAFLFCLAALTALTIGVLAFRPASFPGDGDEAFQFRMCRVPWPVFWSSLRADAVHPPLDYLVDRGFERAIPGSAAARIPVVLWGGLSVAPFGLFFRRRAGRRAALAGGLFLALSLAEVAECRRLRPYALGMLLFGTSLWLLDRLLERPSTRRAAIFAVSSIATAMTLYLAALALVIVTAMELLIDLFDEEGDIRSRARMCLRRLMPFVPAAAAAAAFLAWLLRRAGRFNLAIRPPKLSVLRVWRVAAYAFLSPDAGYSFPPRWFFFSGLILAAALMACGAVLCLRSRRPWIIPLWVIGGYAVIELLKQIHPHFDSFRYFLPLVPAMTALAALLPAKLLARRSTRLAGALLVAVLVVLQGRSLARYYEFGAWNFSSGAAGPLSAIRAVRPSLFSPN